MDVSNSKDDEAIYKVLGRCEAVKTPLFKGWLLAAGCWLLAAGVFIFIFMDLVCPCDCTGMGFHVVMVVFLRCNGPSK